MHLDLTHKNYTIEEIAKAVRHNDLVKATKNPTSPMDTYHVLKAIFKHLTASNLDKCYSSALVAIHNWNAQAPYDTTPYHSIYMNQSNSYTATSLKSDLSRSIRSARMADVYHRTGITEADLARYSTSQIKAIYRERSSKFTQDRRREKKRNERREALARFYHGNRAIN